MMTANEVRESFKKFFEGKGHKIVPSAPMVIKDDPTLMFTNAGMNQWKDIILGTKDPGKDVRRVDTQKCLRVSGKHNDLEEVGHDTYHHTMFEMLGNWSFGDYFKEGAIDMAWEYLTEILKLNPEDLYVTVFEGCKEEGLERDNEAAGYWAKHVPADHIINGNSLGIQCLESLQRGVCTCVRLEICEKLHAPIFPREKPLSTLQLLRQAQGRIAVRGVERLVVAINTATHPFSAIAIRTSESCINGQFLNPKGEMLIQKVGISAI